MLDNNIIAFVIFFIIVIIIINSTRTNKIIPKVIYQTYKDDNNYNFTQCSKNKLMQLNKNYKYVFYTDLQVEDYIKKTWGPDAHNLYLSIDKSYGPARADLFRYLIIYDKGGVYLDIKSSCSKKFDDIFKPDDEYLLTHWTTTRRSWVELLNYKDGEFINWFIAAKPRHVFLKNVITTVFTNLININKNKTKISGKTDVLKTTGPVVYSQCILKDIKDKKAKYRIVSKYNKINLIYNCSNYLHSAVMKDHYTKNNKNIINFTSVYDNKNTQDVVNNIFEYFYNKNK